METLITLGYYISSIGFLIATFIAFNSFRSLGPSGLKTVLSYIFIGTGTFFLITVFQKLAHSGVYSIADESMDVWWHIMFYLAMVSFYLGFKKLVSLGSAESSSAVANPNESRTWGIFSLVVLAIVFVVPNFLESAVNAYTASRVSELGAHHFLAFAMAGVVGAYIFSARVFLGQIGKAIASPMIIAIWALCIQHFWELLTESWKVIEITSDQIEGVEKIFLTISAVCIIYAVLRLKTFATPATPAA